MQEVSVTLDHLDLDIIGLEEEQLTTYIVYVFSLSISYLDSRLAYGTRPLATTYVCYSVHWSSLFLS